MSIAVAVSVAPAPQGWWVHRERAREIAGRLNTAHADLVDVTRTVIEDKTWSGDGIRSPEHWLMLNAGLSRAHALVVVRVAQRRAELPTAARLAAGGAVVAGSGRCADQAHPGRP